MGFLETSVTVFLAVVAAHFFYDWQIRREIAQGAREHCCECESCLEILASVRFLKARISLRLLTPTEQENFRFKEKWEDLPFIDIPDAEEELEKRFQWDCLTDAQKASEWKSRHPITAEQNK
ncbi:MAG: hypothetical protein HYX72_04505 [Acidobacteria bacterium]|nr:hypothetical protein [Acidobacteriota bacterium]